MEGSVSGRVAFGGVSNAVERKTRFTLSTQPPADKPSVDTWQYYDWDGLTRRRGRGRGHAGDHHPYAPAGQA